MLPVRRAIAACPPAFFAFVTLASSSHHRRQITAIRGGNGKENTMNQGMEAVSDETISAGLQYVECPHCHYEVMERPDGKCIACGKNRFDTAGTDPDLTMLTIDNVHRLPAHCFLCGVGTQRVQGFSWTYRISPFALPPVMIPFVFLMS
ncbi:MAG TPA: hypothetical protein PLW86_04585, partial [Rhodocyclaceae bacterium]|nr:hypothetical protein [Rhodocyclaceae bacterium]